MAIGDHSAVIMNDDTLRIFGYNEYGQCGTGSVNATSPYEETDRNTSRMSGVAQVSCGASYTAVLMNDDTLRIFGNNEYGQCGTGSTTTSPFYDSTTINQSTTRISGVAQVACGYAYTAVLMSGANGDLVIFGNNGNGQCGTGSVSGQETNTATVRFSGVAQVACGAFHTAVLMSDGTLRIFGLNSSGQCGTGSVTASPATDQNTSRMSGVAQVACGASHTAVLMNDDTLRIFGYNTTGQCGTGDMTSPATDTTNTRLTNVSSLWDVYTVTIDSTAPVITSSTFTFSATNPNIVNSGGTDYFIGSSGDSVDIDFTATDAGGSDLAQYMITLDNPNTPTSSDFTASFTGYVTDASLSGTSQTVSDQSITISTSTGTHTLRLWILDGAGNVSATQTLSYTHDNVDPSGSINISSSETVANVNSTDFIDSTTVQLDLAHDDSESGLGSPSALILKVTGSSPTTPTTPVVSDFSSGLSLTGTSTDPHNYTTLTANILNTLYYYLIDVAQNIAYIGNLAVFPDTTAPSTTTTNPTITSPYTAEWLGKNKIASKTGSVGFADSGSWIAETNSEYTSAVSLVTFSNSWTSIGSAASTHSISLNTINADQPTVAALSNGSDYYLYISSKDSVGNQSSIEQISFEIDNDDPTISTHSFNNGLNKTLDSNIKVYLEGADATSGVVKFQTIAEGTTTDFVQGSNLATITVNQDYTIGSSGSFTLEVKLFDQADNTASSSETIEKSTQSITWNTLTASRNASSPFIVDVDVDATISASGSPDKIAKYYFCYDVLKEPDPADFVAIAGNMKVVNFAQTFQLFSLSSTEITLVAWLESDPNQFYSKNTANITGASVSGVVTPTNPTLTIDITSPFTETSKTTNEYRLDMTAGTLTIGGTSYTNGDKIIAYIVNESSTAPTPPAYDVDTLSFTDSGGDGWTFVDPNTTQVVPNHSYTFNSSATGSKTVYLWAATMANCSPISVSAQVFFATQALTLTNDVTAPNVNTSSTINSMSLIVSGTAPNQTFTMDGIATSSPVSSSITIEDASGVYRWVVYSYSISNYNSLGFSDTSSWNEPASSPTSVVVTPSFTFVLPQTKTYYLYAQDKLGNISENKLKIQYSPSGTQTIVGITTSDGTSSTLGTNVGSSSNVLKLEGRSTDHSTRNSIVSMFGVGKNHSGFISKISSAIALLRNHKLSDYRGLRVYDIATRADVNLPSSANQPIKFSNFQDKKPRFSDFKFQIYQSNPAIFSVPSVVGDVRKFRLSLDIDTGSVSADLQDDVIDTDITYNVYHYSTFNPTQLNVMFPIAGSSFSVSNGVLEGTFDQEGVYLVRGVNSFGDVYVETFLVQDAAYTIPTGSLISLTADDATFDVSHTVNSHALACDVAFVFDHTSDYTGGSPSFYDRMSTIVSDFIDDFDPITNNSGVIDTRYAVVRFGNIGEYTVARDFTSSKADTISTIQGLASIAATTDSNPQYAIIKRVADGTSLSDWRTSAMKLLVLFTNESPVDTTDSGNWVNSVDDKLINFVLFYGDSGIIVDYTGNRISYRYPIQTNTTTANITSGSTALATAITDSTTLRLEPHIPGLFLSCVADTGFHTGTYPIPYSDLSSSTVNYNVALDPDAIQSICGFSSFIPQGTSININSYITTYNNRNNPISQQKINITFTE